MADRTAFQIIVFDCPPEQVGAVLDVIDEYGLEPNWEDPACGLSTAGLRLLCIYGAVEVCCGATWEVRGFLGVLGGPQVRVAR